MTFQDINKTISDGMNIMSQQQWKMAKSDHIVTGNTLDYKQFKISLQQNGTKKGFPTVVNSEKLSSDWRLN
jgi:hypothetical protein